MVLKTTTQICPLLEEKELLEQRVRPSGWNLATGGYSFKLPNKYELHSLSLVQFGSYNYPIGHLDSFFGVFVLFWFHA